MSYKKRARRAMSHATAQANQRALSGAPDSPELVNCRISLALGAALIVMSVLLPGLTGLKVAAVAVAVLLGGAAVAFVLARGMSSDSNIKHLIDHRERLRSDLNELSDRKKSILASMAALTAEHDERLEELRRQLDAIAPRQACLQAAQRQNLRDLEIRKARCLALADSRLRGLAGMREKEWRELGELHAQKVAELEAELVKLDKDEALERQSELVALQEKSINEFLSGYVIAGSPIIGVSADIAAALAQKGIRTAMDVSWQALQNAGYDGSRAKMLLAWRAYLEQQAQFKKPTQLQKTLRRKIRNKYGKPRQKVESEMGELARWLVQQQEEISEFYRIAGLRLQAVERERAQKAPNLEAGSSELLRQLAEVNQVHARLQERLTGLEKARQTQLISRNDEIARLDKKIQNAQNKVDEIVLPSRLDYFWRVFGIKRSHSLI
jgi:hypothetical protein